MGKISVDTWNSIRKQIQYFSQTAEYLVLKEFHQLDYIAHTFYYTDYDPNKEIEVVRELDFIANNIEQRIIVDHTFRTPFYKNGFFSKSLRSTVISKSQYFTQLDSKNFDNFCTYLFLTITTDLTGRI